MPQEYEYVQSQRRFTALKFFSVNFSNFLLLVPKPPQIKKDGPLLVRRASLHPVDQESDHTAVLQVAQRTDRYFLYLSIRVIETFNQGQNRSHITFPAKGQYGTDPDIFIRAFQVCNQFSDYGLRVIQKGSYYAEV